MPLQSNAEALVKQGDQLFEKRRGLMSLWQELAENFYPERADFTASRSLGSEFANNLATSFPVLCRRDLSNTLSTMMRPRDRAWFKLAVRGREDIDERERSVLERYAKVQRNAMYDRKAGLLRATSEGDDDFATFGQCIISAEFDRSNLNLLYRSWHLRDVAWGETYDNQTLPVHRKWTPTAQQLIGMFAKREGASLHPNVMTVFQKDPYATINVRHIIVQADDYEGEKKWRAPYVSIYLDCDNRHIILEEPCQTKRYIIPRWKTVSGSQYAYSPATVIALPDARLIQSMTWVLLKAGELAIDPPYIAKEGIIRSDANLFAGGITFIDGAYDERLGDAMRPLGGDKSAVGLGLELRGGIEAVIKEAFYLNKISLPSVETSGQMTAFEVGQRVQEYVRQAMPLFEPMEVEYNGALCEESFSLLMQNGLFGPASDLPKALQGTDVDFVFDSPLSESIDKRTTQQLLESKQLLAMVADTDPEAMGMFRMRDALRDALNVTAPAKWILSKAEMEEAEKIAGQKAQQQALMSQMAQGASVAQQIGEAGLSLQRMQGLRE